MIYADHSATTPLRKEAFEAMLPYLTDFYGNPSSIYSIARDTKRAVEQARKQVADALHCKEQEVFFTSGGSEADNWAILGAAYAKQNKKKHIITSAIEHHAVLHTCQYLETQGFRVSYIPVNQDGIIDLDQLKAAICEETFLITVMMANNEIGTIQPIEEIGKIAREKKILFHTDAVQAIGHIPVDFSALPIDLLSLSAHKFGGPKGVGCLLARQGVKINNLIHGGGQENGRRAGTENTAGIIGLATALKIAVEQQPANAERLLTLRNNLIDQVLSTIPYTRLNGDRTQRLPGNANFSFSYIEGESLLLMLDLKGIAASSGSACTSGSLDPSHVLLAIGLPHEIAHGSLRISLGEEHTQQDIDTIVSALQEVLPKLRAMSPLYEGVERKDN